MRIRVGWLRLHTRSRLGPVPGSHHGTKKPLASPRISHPWLGISSDPKKPLKNPPNVSPQKGAISKGSQLWISGHNVSFFWEYPRRFSSKDNKKNIKKQLSTMKVWRVFESMKWNYHLHWTTSKICKVGMEKSLISVWSPLSNFFLGFETVFIEDLYLYTYIYF